jgi:hypothetical protein
MKYIKRFNENNNEEDLKDFCETHLAYLLDDYNFELYVDDINMESMRSLSDSGQIRIENTEGFKWDDIKDYFIPFLKQLDKIRGHQIKIGGEKLVFIHTTIGWTKLPFDDLVNDRTTLRNMYWDKIHIELNETY